jgi:hypothetical protein
LHYDIVSDVLTASRHAAMPPCRHAAMLQFHNASCSHAAMQPYSDAVGMSKTKLENV